MNKIKTCNYLPKESIISSSFGKIDYSDAFMVEISKDKIISIDEICFSFFNISPKWINKLLKIRDLIVKPFGLKLSKSLSELNNSKKKLYEIGDRIGFFKIKNRSDFEIVLAEDDKHLNFRTSVLICLNSDNEIVNLYSSTIVQFNNLFGKIYFCIIKPFHKYIIKSTLKTLIKQLNSINYENKNIIKPN